MRRKNALKAKRTGFLPIAVPPNKVRNLNNNKLLGLQGSYRDRHNEAVACSREHGKEALTSAARPANKGVSRRMQRG